MKWSRGLFPGLGASSSLAPAHSCSLLLSGLVVSDHPFTPPATLQCESPQLLLQEQRKSHTGGTPLVAQKYPLKLMAITEELMKGTAMVAVTRPLLQEQSRST